MLDDTIVYIIIWGSLFRTTVIFTPGACPGGSELHSVSRIRGIHGIRGIRGIRGRVQICSNLRPLSKLSVLWSQMSDPSRTSAFRPSKTQGFWSLFEAKVQKHKVFVSFCWTCCQNLRKSNVLQSFLVVLGLLALPARTWRPRQRRPTTYETPDPPPCHRAALLVFRWNLNIRVKP